MKQFCLKGHLLSFRILDLSIVSSLFLVPFHSCCFLKLFIYLLALSLFCDYQDLHFVVAQ